MIHATTRLSLKHIMLGLRSQTQKTKFPYDFIYMKRKGKSIKEKQMNSCLGLGVEQNDYKWI